jgi:hypothetical protein
LQVNSKALKYFAETFGYDFNKPYKVVGILGKFTANSIEKITGDSNALLFITNDNDIKIVKLNNGKFEVKDIKGNYTYKISNFYSQGDFEEKRKSGETATYIIQQDKQYLRKIKENNTGRVGIYVNNVMKYFDEMSESEIAQIQLQERLKIYKANKRKTEAEATDYTTEIMKIDNEFVTLKNEIISRLTNATTYEEYEIISKVTGYKLPSVVCGIAKFKNDANNKKFVSTKHAQDSINNIKSKITEMWEHLNKAV